MDDNFIMEREVKTNVVAMIDGSSSYESARRIYGTDGVSLALNTCGGGGHEPKITDPVIKTRPHGYYKGGYYSEYAPAVKSSAYADNNYVEQEVLDWSRDNKGNVTNRHSVDVANTVTSAKRDNTQNYVKECSYRIRKLTERECFRLMDVSDEDIDKIQNAGISRSQQYKMAGNSIVVACMEKIFEKLFIDTEITEPTLF